MPGHPASAALMLRSSMRATACTIRPEHRGRWLRRFAPARPDARGWHVRTERVTQTGPKRSRSAVPPDVVITLRPGWQTPHCFRTRSAIDRAGHGQHPSSGSASSAARKSDTERLGHGHRSARAKAHDRRRRPEANPARSHPSLTLVVFHGAGS